VDPGLAQNLGEQAQGPLYVVRVDPLERIGFDVFFGPITQQPLGCQVVLVAHGAVGPDDRDEVRNVMKHALEASLSFTQRSLVAL
jgi:hypothetical protein